MGSADPSLAATVRAGRSGRSLTFAVDDSATPSWLRSAFPGNPFPTLMTERDGAASDEDEAALEDDCRAENSRGGDNFSRVRVEEDVNDRRGRSVDPCDRDDDAESPTAGSSHWFCSTTRTSSSAPGPPARAAPVPSADRARVRGVGDEKEGSRKEHEMSRESSSDFAAILAEPLALLVIIQAFADPTRSTPGECTRKRRAAEPSAGGHVDSGRRTASVRRRAQIRQVAVDEKPRSSLARLHPPAWIRATPCLGTRRRT